jgi:hypothetical protein
MTKIFKLSLLTSTLIFTGITNAANIDKLFLDKAYWAKFNWDSVEKSEIYLDKRLETKEPETDEKKWYFEKFGDVELNGVALKESVIRHTSLAKNNRKFNLSVISETKNQETCGNIISMYEKNFGNNFERTEYTSGIENMPLLSKTIKYAEWLNGKTNIKIECTQLFRDNFHVNIVYLPNIEENRVKKPINLSCERNYRVTGSNQTGTARPLHFSVLQEPMEVVNADNVLMGKVDEITNTYIKFTSDLEDAIQKYTINRIDGGLSGTYLNTKTNQVTATYSGTCVKRVSEERKF